MITGPCLNCKDRSVGCHSTCDKYINFRKELDNHNEKIHNEKELANANRSYVIKSVENMRKKSRTSH